MVEDSQLIDATLSGDQEAFGTLVVRYQQRLFNAMAHTVGSREEAEDVVQDAFVQAFVNLNRFEKKSRFYTWLYRIALNVRCSRARRKRPKALGEAATELAARQPDHSPTAAQQAITSERCDQLQAALQELTEEYREIVILREIEQNNYEEISEILDIPVGTVRSRLHRARSQLQTILQSRYSEL